MICQVIKTAAHKNNHYQTIIILFSLSKSHKLNILFIFSFNLHTYKFKLMTFVIFVLVCFFLTQITLINFGHHKYIFLLLLAFFSNGKKSNRNSERIK